MRKRLLASVITLLLLFTVPGSLAKMKRSAAPLFAPPPLRPVDPKAVDFERHIVIPPGQAVTLCIKGRWRIAGREFVTASGYDTADEDQIFFPNFFCADGRQCSIARMSLVYRVTQRNEATGQQLTPQFFSARNYDSPDQTCRFIFPPAGTPSGFTTYIDFIAADEKPSDYTRHELDPANPLSVTTNISTISPAPGPWPWPKITDPAVNARITPRPDIKFQRGDRIMVEAGGCVNTGGKWRPYVDPYANHSNDPDARDAARIYHGLIWIPGATPGPVRISSILGKELSVPTDFDDQSQLFLRLGYEDDDDHYGSNGYGGSLPGGDCTEHAWVQIEVSSGTERSAKPMDLIWRDIDDNWLMDTPKWRWQIENPGALPGFKIVQNQGSSNWKLPISDDSILPTTQTPAIDFNDRIIVACKDGPHVNWYPVTYHGPIYWVNHTGRPGGDDDYNMVLLPRDPIADCDWM